MYCASQLHEGSGVVVPSAIQQRGLLRLLVEEDTDFEAISPPPVRTVEFCPQSCLQSACSSFRRLPDSSACGAITSTAGSLCFFIRSA